MRAPISVILPTLDSAATLPQTAAALLPGVTGGLIAEMVVSDGGSRDATAEIARALGANWVSGPVGRGGQIARGIAAAKGEWLLLLHADTHLAPNWTEAAERHMAEHPDTAGWFHLRFRAAGLAPRVVEAGASLRSRFGLPYGDQGLLVSRRMLEAAGGMPDLPLMEDVALARRLRGRLRPLGAKAHTSAARYEADGWTRRVARNLGTLARYGFGADPVCLKKVYEASRKH